MYKFLFNVEEDFTTFIIESFLVKDSIVSLLAVAVRHNMFGYDLGVL